MKLSLLMQKKLFYVTTPIFYVNAQPHIGHLYSALLADVQCRWKLLKNEQGSFMATGTDEHGVKIQKQAALNKKDCNKFCDDISGTFRKLFDLCDIKYSDFIRTTEDRHKKAVTHLWNVLYKNGHIYKSTYDGWYSVSDENFLSENEIHEIVDPKTGTKIMASKESGNLVERISEANYMFRLTDFKDRLKKYLDGNVVIPSDKYKQSLFQAIDNINDLSVSREAKRVSWGIQVPNDPTQVIYVWLDALTNYLTAAGYPDDTEKFNKLWPADVHIVGKDIIKFHAIYWPAFLFAANIEPPKRILCHGHWLMENKKMSKSLGNVIDPFEFRDKYTTDGIRYFLIREGIPATDNNINIENAVNTINAELSNTLGNLFQRCAAKAINPNGVYPSYNEIKDSLNEENKKLIARLNNLRVECNEDYENFNFYEAIRRISDVLKELNILIQETKPWVLVKEKSEKNEQELYKLFFLTFETLRICSILLHPVIPNLTKKLFSNLNLNEADINFKNAVVNVEMNIDSSRKKINLKENEVLFKRISLIK